VSWDLHVLPEGVAQVQQPAPPEKHRKRLFGLF
jgi:hypothetical protein